MDTEGTEFGDELCQRIDRACAKRISGKSAKVSRGALIRRLYPVINKYRLAGLTLDDIVDVLQTEGHPINRGHLVWHLGAIKKAAKEVPPTAVGVTDSPSEKGAEQSAHGAMEKVRFGGTSRPTHRTSKPAVPSGVPVEVERWVQPVPEFPYEKPLGIPGQHWMTGESVRWWEWPTPAEADYCDPRIPAPLPMPLHYALPEELRPDKMPPLPNDWTTYRIEPVVDDKTQLIEIPGGRSWWCYRYPRMPEARRHPCLYAVLPGVDAEAPYGRYPDGRPYQAETKVWGPGPSTRDAFNLNEVPPGETNTVDMFFSFVPTPTDLEGYKAIDKNDTRRYDAWAEAARRCGVSTEFEERGSYA